MTDNYDVWFCWGNGFSVANFHGSGSAVFYNTVSNINIKAANLSIILDAIPNNISILCENTHGVLTANSIRGFLTVVGSFFENSTFSNCLLTVIIHDAPSSSFWFADSFLYIDGESQNVSLFGSCNATVGTTSEITVFGFAKVIGTNVYSPTVCAKSGNITVCGDFSTIDNKNATVRIVNASVNHVYGNSRTETIIEDSTVRVETQENSTALIMNSNISYGEFHGYAVICNSHGEVVFFSNADIYNFSGIIHDGIGFEAAVDIPERARAGETVVITWEIRENIRINGTPACSIRVYIDGNIAASLDGNATNYSILFEHTITVCIEIEDLSGCEYSVSREIKQTVLGEMPEFMEKYFIITFITLFVIAITIMAVLIVYTRRKRKYILRTYI